MDIETARKVGTLLRKRRETVSVIEGTTGGLINASLQTAPGASRFCVAGVSVYSAQGGRALLPRAARQPLGGRENYSSAARYVSSKQVFVDTLAPYMQATTKSTWAIAESGATDATTFPPNSPLNTITTGFTSIRVVGPGNITRTESYNSPHNERIANMAEYTTRALRLLLAALETAEADAVGSQCGDAKL